MKDGLERFPHFCVLVKNSRPEFVPFLLVRGVSAPYVRLRLGSGRRFRNRTGPQAYVELRGRSSRAGLSRCSRWKQDGRANRLLLRTASYPCPSPATHRDPVAFYHLEPAAHTGQEKQRHEWRKYLSPWKGREHARLYLVQTPPKDRLEFPVSQVRHIPPPIPSILQNHPYTVFSSYRVP